ncbi:branched-chain amino acid ABC transporter permease [Variovorax saccharolyticus]|uniref:branched-chain amino acid ABC transporter permease n=1 Tax=Variovorax saccharolyticus TaxID=3053516 RepID=UPI0025771769|nr:branched-chain amino acid ABC transporter permease [Variovorax sp. J31P216]MDM0025348.1 branched-chain amino acid ABC transporter permease [Variovorax sp. J31P216]
MNFTLPSLSLLSQSILSGIFVGALYGLMGLGLSLSWGLLRLINLAHFAFAFLAAYLCYQLSTMGMDPLLTMVVIVPAFFALGAGLHWVMVRFQVTPFNSLLLTFGLTGIAESVIQSIWTADFRKLESSYAEQKFKLAGLFVPVPELITLVLAVGLSFAVWALLRYTDLGRAMRAAAQDAPVAAAFGVNQKALGLALAGTCAALASVAGVCLALSFTLAPSQMYAWVGVVFAAVMLGGLGSALGPLVAGTVIGISEAITMAVTAPSWAPIVSFTLLIVILVLRPGKTA